MNAASDGAPIGHTRLSAQIDDDTKRHVRQLAEELAPLQRAKEDAVANGDFPQAAQLRDKQDQCWKELQNLNLPAIVLTNVRQLIDAWPNKVSASRFPLLDMLHDEAGEPDAAVLAMLPNPMIPPVKIIVKAVPRYPVSTLNAVLAPDDIGSRYFQALVPLISPESVARFKSRHRELVRVAFSEIGRAESLIFGRAVLLCVLCPTACPKMFRQSYLRASIEPTAISSCSRNRTRFGRCWENCPLERSCWKTEASNGKAEAIHASYSALSAQTFIMKWVFAPLWIGGFGLGTCLCGLMHFRDATARRSRRLPCTALARGS